MTTTSSMPAATKVDNGVNVSALPGAREALEKAPEEASRSKDPADASFAHAVRSNRVGRRGVKRVSEYDPHANGETMLIALLTGRMTAEPPRSLISEQLRF
jgi:hypothetical protein